MAINEAPKISNGKAPNAGVLRKPRRKVGEPLVWLSGGATALGIAMILSLIGLIAWEGLSTFWPRELDVFVLGAENKSDEESGQKAINYRLVKDGKFVEPEVALGSDLAKGHHILVGTEWNSEPLEPTLLPLNKDTRRPWQSFEIEDARKLYIRIGNAGESIALPEYFEGKREEYSSTLIDNDKAFKSAKVGIPQIEVYKELRPDAYADTVIHRAPADSWTVAIDRQIDSSAFGHVVEVHSNGKLLASADRDGIDRVWQIFNERLSAAQDALDARRDYEEERGQELAHLGNEINDRILEIRHHHRRSAEVVSLAGRLNYLYDEWKNSQPPIHPETHEGNTAPPAPLETRVKDWLWAPSIEGRPEFTLSGEADIEESVDALIGSFPLDPKLESDAESFRGLYAKVWNEYLLATKAAGADAYHQAHLKELSELIQLFARKAIINAVLRIPTDQHTAELRKAESDVTYTLQTFDGRKGVFLLSHVVRAFRPNNMNVFGKLGVFADRFFEFVAGRERLRNEVEGTVKKIILGTMLMTMLMALAVVPFGVITALYLREYAKQGPLVSAVRVAVNNLAGVPSIVFGIFGFGFFSIMVGGQIDDWLYPHRLPNPTYGGGGILWASLTLALLTVPVVVVATEEALASVSSSQREASLGCGASRFQTILRVILPQATPGILTGMILAMARGAGEVAPLMLVGVVPSAEHFPIDSFAPFFHFERKFEHLGFHIFDLSFQYKDPDYSRPFVFSSALILLGVVAALNIFAIRLRNRLRRRFKTSHV